MLNWNYNSGDNINFVYKKINHNYEYEWNICKIQHNVKEWRYKMNVTCCGVTSSVYMWHGVQI